MNTLFFHSHTSQEHHIKCSITWTAASQGCTVLQHTASSFISNLYEDLPVQFCTENFIPIKKVPRLVTVEQVFWVLFQFCSFMAIPIMSYLLYFFGTHKNFMVCIFFQKKIHEPNDKFMNQLAMSYKHGISKHKEKLFQICFLLCKMISNFSKASKTGINH